MLTIQSSLTFEADGIYSYLLKTRNSRADEVVAEDRHRQALHRELDETFLQQLLQGLDVGGHPGHDHARLLLSEVVE